MVTPNNAAKEVLSLSEIQSATDLDGKVASAESAKDMVNLINENRKSSMYVINMWDSSWDLLRDTGYDTVCGEVSGANGVANVPFYGDGIYVKIRGMIFVYNGWDNALYANIHWGGWRGWKQIF